MATTGVWKTTACFVSILILLILTPSVPRLVHAQVSSPVVWSHTYLGIGVQCESVIQTSDGGFLLVCSDLVTPDLTSLTGSSTTHQFYLLKVDASGNQQWNRTLNGIIYQESQGVIQTSDGGFAVAAEFQNCFMLIKTDQFGKQQWNQTYAGAGVCVPNALIQTSDGGYALVGLSNYLQEPTYLQPGDDVWLVKTNSQGTLQWDRTLGQGQPKSLIQTADGGYAIAGAPVDKQFLFLKTDSTGNLQLNESYGTYDEGSAYSVVQTSDGGYVLGGWMWIRTNGAGYKIAILKADAEGNVQWTQSYGSGFGDSMTQTSNGGFVIAGTKLVKVDSSGTEIGEVGLEGQAYSVIQTQDGNYAVAGQVDLNGTYTTWLAKIDAASVNETPQPTVTQSPTSTPATTQSPTVPEFPTWTLLVASAATLLAAMLAKKSRFNQTRCSSRKKENLPLSNNKLKNGG